MNFIFEADEVPTVPLTLISGPVTNLRVSSCFSDPLSFYGSPTKDFQKDRVLDKKGRTFRFEDYDLTERKLKRKTTILTGKEVFVTTSFVFHYRLERRPQCPPNRVWISSQSGNERTL